ncbi:M14 family metallopeptidase [Ramlibacter sp. Leaf400]|uniref:M14 family metallopeptidase n=1 Tax=Ramlibacter sp. Leaf400 TaxID=1736365 RepID=UPI0006F710F9|nr:M14 family metallopeptidase [Ramlibacter sp. Leaf400]KQT14345.1 hypothetical protein ASG30_01845 [Ramlibacter sp. Leaf400]
MTLDDAFSHSYAQARRKFIDAAGAAGVLVEAKRHPEKGRDGEELAMDVAREGEADASRVLVLSSACHGVEGFCGSGVQVSALHDAEWREHARRNGVAVVYIHALNPFGFSHIRRTTQENVDLNRNFHDFSKPLPRNARYGELHDMLFPDEWPPSKENDEALAAWVEKNGQMAYQAAISSGQHEFPRGMYFGGEGPTWSNRTLREVLRAHGRRAGRIAWIDFHTGLGPSGLGERIFAGPDDPVQVARARSWWDGGGRTPVTSIYDGSSTSAKLTGMMWSSIFDECPQAEYTGIAMEYGTQPVLQVLHALRADHWLDQHPEASPELKAQIKREVLEAFYTDTPEWKRRIVEQAREAMFQAVDGLAH